MTALSRCPHCGARGVKIADRLDRDGITLRLDYCGRCGKTYPQADRSAVDWLSDGTRPAVVPLHPRTDR